MRSGIGPNDPCPCGLTNKMAKHCHLGGDNEFVVPERAQTRPPGQRTGYAHPKCYARQLSDCSNEISGEHFMSEGVLQLLAGSTPGVEVRGASFQRGNPHPLLTRPASLKAKVLCTRHNSALSPLDDLAKILFRFLLDVEELAPQTPRALLVRGPDIERWMLKALCGALASKVADAKLSLAARHTFPNRRLLDVLFGDDEFLTPHGLYLDRHQSVFQVGPHASLRISSTETDVHALRVGVLGIGFVLSTGASSEPRLTPDQYVYRPGDVALVRDHNASTVYMGWDQPGVRYFRQVNAA